ncbi:MAG: 1-acyl-sn-glycerol-3-phosphate acyltransferase [Rickettsiales bacterium]|jgi:1-acyl-sn-glycerol-3-phosphate acyltransferase
MKIRSYIFDIALIIFTSLHNLLYFLFVPIFLLVDFSFKIFGKDTNFTKLIADKWAKFWAIILMLLLRIICGISYEVRGKENIPKNRAVIIASKHQSMWETIIMHILINCPVYIYKKELLKIPFYGWYLRFMSGTVADREGGAKALKSIVRSTKEYVKNKQSIVIFPQGTRTQIGAKIEDYPYKSGLLGLYNFLKIPVVPVALNSGLHWTQNHKKPGKIIIEFLPIIEANLEKDEFVNLLRGVIERKSDELIKYD